MGQYNIEGQNGTDYDEFETGGYYGRIDLPGRRGYLCDQNFKPLSASDNNVVEEALPAVASVSGRVIFASPDPDNHVQKMEAGLPVDFVYDVDGVETTITTTTDANGNYTFTDVPVGVTGKIVFANGGYSGCINNVTVPEAGLSDMNLVTSSSVSLDAFT